MISKFLTWSILLSVLLVQGCISVNVSLTPSTAPLKEHIVEGEGTPKILLVDVSGFISQSGRGGSLMNLEKKPSAVVHMREALIEAEEDDNIAGVIININSPGGTVTASDIIYHELLKFKEKKKVPVYAVITGTGTSGAYYIAAAADTIISHPTAITGSIGVIALKFNIESLMNKIGIDNETIKSGDKKDIFSPFRPITTEERALMQEIIDHLYGRFVDSIYTQRKDLLTREEIMQLGDGRLYTADKALELKLIDHVEYLDDSINRMKEALNIEDARVITYNHSGKYNGTIYSSDQPDNSSILGLLGGEATGFSPLSGIEFLYLWRP